MEKLEILLQEMVIRRCGKKSWHSILQRSLALCDFDQHIESYGTQRVAMLGKLSPVPECNRTISAGSSLLTSAAELLGMTVSGMLEELGGYYAHDLRNGTSPPRPFTSVADYFSAAAFYYNSCSWILETIVPGSLQVTSGADGRLKIRCALRENDMGIFLKGFLSEIQGGLEGPAAITHSETISPGGDFIHSFVSRNGMANARDDRAGSLVAIAK